MIAEKIQDILKRHGYDPKDAKKLQDEGMGPEELEHRIKTTRPGGMGSLSTLIDSRSWLRLKRSLGTAIAGNTSATMTLCGLQPSSLGKQSTAHPCKRVIASCGSR